MNEFLEAESSDHLHLLAHHYPCCQRLAPLQMGLQSSQSSQEKDAEQEAVSGAASMLRIHFCSLLISLNRLSMSYVQAHLIDIHCTQ